MADTLTPDSYMAEINSKLTPDEYMKQSDAAIAHGNPMLTEEGKFQPPELIDKFRYFLGRHLSNILPAAGAMLGGSRLGLKGAVGGATAGSYTSNLARNLAPRAFGSPSDTPNQDALSDTITQGVVPEAGGAIAGKITQGLMDFAQGGLPGMMRSILSNPTVAKLSPSIRGAVATGKEAEAAAAQTSKVREMLKPPTPESSVDAINLGRANRESMGAFEQQQIREEVMARNAAAAKSHEQVTSLIHEGFSPATGTFDGAKILNSLEKNPEAYAGIDPTLRANLRTLAEAQTKGSSVTKEKVTDPILSYIGKRVVFNVATSQLGHLVAGAPGAAVTGGITGSLTLGEVIINKLMSNPETSSLVVKALKTPSTAPEAGFVSALLKHAIRGQEVLLTTPEEKNVRAVVGPNGHLQYPAPSQQ